MLNCKQTFHYYCISVAKIHIVLCGIYIFITLLIRIYDRFTLEID